MQSERTLKVLAVLLIAGVTLFFQERGTAADTVLYQTGFELSEGFEPEFTVVGQGKPPHVWEGSDDSGNGLTIGFFEEMGQHAYIGFSPPALRNTRFVNLWTPINYTPPSPTQSLVQFSVRMQIEPSTNNVKDSFRWSLYNIQTNRLFTLEFDTEDLQISYLLDNTTNYVATGSSFDTLGFYDLRIWMDFRRNLWTASLNNVVVVNSKPITAKGAALNLADIDAVWELRAPSTPGNNFMVFDDYRVAVSTFASAPPILEPLGIGTNGAFIVRIFGQENLNYAVDATSDGTNWQTLGTFKAPVGGIFDYEDTQFRQTSYRFFRVRQVQ